MGDTEAMREALADAILSLRSEANLASRAGQHDRLHAIADSLNAASRAALAALPAPVPDKLSDDEQHIVNGCRTLSRQFTPQTEGEMTLLNLVMRLADFIDRLTSAAPVPEGVPEDRIVPEGMANIGGVTYWAHPTTCGCSYYRAEMMTEGPCVCGHDQDDHDYYDGGCEAPDPHRARLVPLSDTPHEEGEQP